MFACIDRRKHPGKKNVCVTEQCKAITIAHRRLEPSTDIVRSAWAVPRIADEFGSHKPLGGHLKKGIS